MVSALLFISTFAVYNVLCFYIVVMVRKWFLPFLSKKGKYIFYFFCFLIVNSFMIGILLAMDVITALGYYWLALLYILVLCVPFLHLAVSVILHYSKLARRKVETWAACVTLLFTVVVFSWGTFQAYSPVVRTYDVNLSKQVEVGNDLNIIMVADTHFGLLSNKFHAEQMVEKINASKPDIVLIAGDIIDDKLDSYLELGIDDVLAEIQSTYGVYASLGNHDLGDTSKLISVIEESHINILYDETIEVADSITLIGRKDRVEEERMPLSQLMNDVDKEKPIILLDHQPDELEIALSEGVDLMVSGHTHRGQLAPFQLATERIYENDWGHLQKGTLHSIVTSGYGFWGPPIRTNSRSEIVQINLHY